MPSYISQNNIIPDPIGSSLFTYKGPDPMDFERDMSVCKQKCDENSACKGFVRSLVGDSYFSPPKYNFCWFFDDSKKTFAEKTDTYSKYILYTKNPTDETRKDIDEKIAAIYEVPGTETANYKESYEQTMNMGILWAAVGTVVLFYTFKSTS